MKPPDWKVTGAAGLVLGLAISGISFASPSRAELAVQPIQLEAGADQPSAAPALPIVNSRATPMPTAEAPASPTPTLGPLASHRATVVAPPVVSEGPPAAPKGTHRATPKPAADEDAADDAEDAADEASDAADEAEHGD
jgi:hypothetical protein